MEPWPNYDRLHWSGGQLEQTADDVDHVKSSGDRAAVRAAALSAAPWSWRQQKNAGRNHRPPIVTLRRDGGVSVRSFVSS